MKLFKKIFLPVLSAACVLAACAAFAACGGSGDTSDSTSDTSVDLDASLTDTQYAVYVYLDDGTTPVEGITFQLCYNLNETQSTCSATNYTTDSNGRVVIDMSVIDTYVGSPVIHITYLYDYTTEDADGNYAKIYSCLPEGYSIPSSGTTVYLNDGAYYEDAWSLTEKVTTLTLTKA